MAQRAAQLGLIPPQAVAEAALSYVRSHGHLVSCALDLRPYTSRMEAGSAAWLAQHLSELAAGLPGVGVSNGSGCDSGSRVEANGGPVSSPSPAGLKERVKAVRTWVCCQQLLDDLGLPLLSDPQQAVSRAGACLATLGKSASVVGKSAAFHPLPVGDEGRVTSTRLAGIRSTAGSMSGCRYFEQKGTSYKNATGKFDEHTAASSHIPQFTLVMYAT